MKKKEILTHLFFLAITAVLLFMIFRPVLEHPNGYLFSKRADGLKSYYNFSYYLKYDKGIRFDGVNYPYGDHLLYMNTHPLYIQFWKFVEHHLYHVSPYGVSILNLTMILSLLLAIPFLLLIMRRFALPRWYAGVMAVIILFLSPQIGRLGGHFEMVYAFFLPMYLYWMIRWHEGRRRWLWGTLMVVTALVGGFTSAYYAAFFFVFPMAFLLVRLWTERRNLKKVGGEAAALFVMALIPVVAVKGVVMLTDWVDDRPQNPWGFYVYHANIWSIFLPSKSMLKDLFPRLTRYSWEGKAFVGHPAMWLAVTLTVTFLWHLLRRKKPPMDTFFFHREMNVFLAAAFIVLLFSMCIPFKWGMHFLTDLIPPLKQFRSLGRFSWWFYYLYGIFTAWFIYLVYRWLRRHSRVVPAGLLVAASLVYWSLDAGIHVKIYTRDLFNSNDRLESTDKAYLQRFREGGHSPGEYQAIFFLPFASTGGDKLLYEQGLDAFGEAMRCSYHTHLPIVESFSPRPSFTQILSSIQLLSHPAIYKKRVDDMNDKPLLLVVRKQPLNSREQWVFDQATVWWEDQYISLATLPVQVFNDVHRQWTDSVRALADTLPCEGQICAGGDIATCWFEGFDDREAEHVLNGKGAFYMKKGTAEILNRKFFFPEEDIMMELSLWIYFDERTYGMPEMWLERIGADGKMKGRDKLNTHDLYDVYRRWMRVRYLFQPKEGVRYRLVVKGKYVTVDDLLVRPAHMPVLIRTGDDFDLFNNYPLEKRKAGSREGDEQ